MTDSGADGQQTVPTRTRSPLYSAVIGLTALAVLLQGLWAGLFVREGKNFDATSSQSNFVTVHEVGGTVAQALALVALIIAIWQLRRRKDLVIGTAVLFVLLVVEGFLGEGIGDNPTWPSYHIPLAMLLMALCVWLPFRATRR
jgi:heme A synthase